MLHVKKKIAKPRKQKARNYHMTDSQWERYRHGGMASAQAVEREIVRHARAIGQKLAVFDPYGAQFFFTAHTDDLLQGDGSNF